MQYEASEPVSMGRALDAYALAVFLEDEAGSAQVENLIQQALRGEIRLEMTVVNLGEVYYSTARKKSLKVAESILDILLGLPIEFVGVDWDLARQAALFKVNGGIAYVDCFAAALAYQRGVPLVTGDPEFHCLEGFISIEWI